MTQSSIPVRRREFVADLEHLRRVVLVMGEAVDGAITRAMGGLVDRDVETCTAVIEGDRLVNGLQREVRDLSFTMLLTQAPVAGDLRAVLGCLHMAAELERMGDHCVSIAKIARNLADLPGLETYVAIPRMADLCAAQVRDMLGAVMVRDADRARQIAGRDDRIDRLYHRLFDELIQLMIDGERAVYVGTHLIFITHHLERIADRVTNIAEDVVFLETGEIEELG